MFNGVKWVAPDWTNQGDNRVISLFKNITSFKPNTSIKRWCECPLVLITFSHSYLVRTTRVQAMYNIDKAFQNERLERDQVCVLYCVVRWRCCSSSADRQSFQQNVESCWTYSPQCIFLQLKHSTNYDNTLEESL